MIVIAAAKKISFQAFFRTTGRGSLWHPESGKIRDLPLEQRGPRLQGRFELGPYEGVFVVVEPDTSAAAPSGAPLTGRPRAQGSGIPLGSPSAGPNRLKSARPPQNGCDREGNSPDRNSSGGCS